MMIKTNKNTAGVLGKVVAGFIYQMSEKDTTGNLKGPDLKELDKRGFTKEQYNGMLKVFYQINTSLTQYKSKLN